MKKTLILSLGFAFTLAGCASGPVGSQPDTASASQVCQPISEQEVAALFDRWNQALQTGNPQQVLASYAERSILLPTVSNKPRLTKDEKIDYFEHFIQNKPIGTIDMRMITIGCNSAVDAGLYTFTYGTTGKQVNARYTYTYEWDNGQWLITSHHSSGMPEK